MAKAKATVPFGKRFPARDSAAARALAANVRRLRKMREWTQHDLADAVEIEQAAISLIENGRANPTLLILESVANVFDVRIGDLFAIPAQTRKPKDKG
jgi:transcriptional regulator with XRE-family HTH domain